MRPKVCEWGMNRACRWWSMPWCTNTPRQSPYAEYKGVAWGGERTRPVLRSGGSRAQCRSGCDA